MIAVAAFCRIVLWLEKKLRRHRRAIATPMFIYLSWKYTIFGLRGLRVGRRGRLDYSLPPLSLFFTCLRKFPRRDRGGSHVKRRGKQRDDDGGSEKEERRSCDFKSTKFITCSALPLSSVLVSNITYKYNDGVTAAQIPFLSYHYHQTTRPPCSNEIKY